MATSKIEIILAATDRGVKAALSGVNAALATTIKSSQAYQQTLQSLNGTADHFRSTMAGLVATIGGANLFRAAASQAISFNSTVEQSQIGIAALVRTFGEASGKTVSMAESMAIAADIQKRLQIEGLKTVATYEQLLKALQEGIGPALKAGFNPEQVVKFTSLMTQAAAALSVPMDQLGQEIRAILDGTIDQNARVAKALGLTNEKIKEMAAQGKLFDYLSAKLKAFGDAGDAMSQTFSGAWSNLQDAVQMGLGTGLEQSFKSTTTLMLRMRDAIVTIDEQAGTFTFNEKIVAALSRVDQALNKVLGQFSTDQLSQMIANLVEAFGSVVVAVINFISYLARLGELLGPMAPAVASLVTQFFLWGGAFKLLLGLPIALYAQIKALTAGLLTLVGLQVPSWLIALHTSLTMVTTAFGPLTLAVVGLSSVLLGLQIGEWLYKQTTQAERDLAKMRTEIDATRAKFAQFASFAPTQQSGLWSKSQAELDAYKKELEGAYRYQVALVQQLTIASRERGMFGGLTDGARQAQKELGAAKERLGQISAAMDDYGAVAHDASREASAAASTSAGTMQKVTGAALEEMKKKYKEYANEVRRINDEIASRGRSLYAELREMARTGMTDYSAWKDRKREAEEYAVAARRAADEAKQAMASGDEITAAAKWKEAIQYADDSKNAYKSLNTEVKSGEQVVVSQQQALKTAMNGVKSSGTLAIEILKEQKNAAKDAMQEMEGKAALKELTDGMSAAEKQWLENWKTMAEYTLDQINQIDTRLDEVANKRRTATMVIEYEDGGREVVRHRWGGLVQRFARGGKLPGYGGGDRISALLEAGEFVIRKEAVAKFGSGLFHALNNLRLPEIPRFATGGLVGAGATDTVNINLTLPSGATYPMTASRVTAAEINRENARLHRLRSR